MAIRPLDYDAAMFLPKIGRAFGWMNVRHACTQGYTRLKQRCTYVLETTPLKREIAGLDINYLATAC